MGEKMKMIKGKNKLLCKLLLIIFIVSTLIPVSGCWSRRELEDLAFILALGIDRQEDDFIIYALVGEPAQGVQAEGEDDELTVIEGTGKTISAAYDQLFENADKRPFLSHLKIIILSEELAQDGIKRSVDFIRRDIRVRGNTVMTVGKGDLKEILGTQPILGGQPAISIEETIRFNAERSKVFNTQMTQMVRDLFEEDIELVMPVISLVEEKIAIRNAAYFINTTMKGTIDNKQVLGLLWLRGEVQHGVFTINPVREQGKYITFQLMSTKVAVNPVIRDDEKLVFYVDINQNLQLNDDQSSLSIDEMEEEAEQYIKNTVLETINHAKEAGSDYIGFGKRYRRKYPARWDAENWPEEFQRSEVIIRVNTLINIEER